MVWRTENDVDEDMEFKNDLSILFNLRRYSAL